MEGMIGWIASAAPLDAAALAPVGFDAVDHAISTFERAAVRLANG